MAQAINIQSLNSYKNLKNIISKIGRFPIIKSKPLHSKIICRMHEEARSTPPIHENVLVGEIVDLEPVLQDSGPMFEFDDEPPANKKDDQMEFVEYPQSPNARSKLSVWVNMSYFI